MKLTKDQRAAVEQFRAFRDADPKKIVRVEFNDPPDTVIPVGIVEYVGYRTTHERVPTLYEHEFTPGSRPLLVAGRGDCELYLVGGRYRFTDRGIVDLDAHLREILNPRHGK